MRKRSTGAMLVDEQVYFGLGPIQDMGNGCVSRRKMQAG
jgi:hypothetical protein